MNKKKLIISTMVTTMVSASMVPIIAIDNIVFEKNEKVLSQTRDEQSIDIGKKILDYINVKYEKKNLIMYRMLGTSGWLKDKQYNKIVYNNNSYISFDDNGRLLQADTGGYKLPANVSMEHSLMDSISKKLYEEGYTLKNVEKYTSDDNDFYRYERILSGTITNPHDFVSIFYDKKNNNIIRYKVVENRLVYKEPRISPAEAKLIVQNKYHAKSEEISDIILTTYKDVDNSEVKLSYSITINFNRKIYMDPEDGSILGESMYKVDLLKSNLENSINLSKNTFDESENVVLVSEKAIPDALSSAGLAGCLNAPILLSERDDLNNKLAKELSRLKTKNVYLVSGKNMISPKVINSLKSMGYNVVDYSGTDRYETSANVAKSLKSDKYILASGKNFADIPSISPYAYEYKIPVILTSRDSISDKNRTAIKSGTQLVSIGGYDTISQKVYDALASKNLKITRIAGIDRYATSKEIAKSLYPDRTSYIIELNKNTMANILSAPLSARLKKPILVYPDKMDDSIKNLIDKELKGSILFR